MTTSTFSMLVLAVAWAVFGALFWVKNFIELFEQPYLRPGLFELFFFMILGPAPFIKEAFKR